MECSYYLLLKYSRFETLASIKHIAHNEQKEEKI